MAKNNKQDNDIEKLNNKVFKNLDNDSLNIANEIKTLNSKISNKNDRNIKLLEKEKSLKLKKKNE